MSQLPLVHQKCSIQPFEPEIKPFDAGEDNTKTFDLASKMISLHAMSTQSIDLADGSEIMNTDRFLDNMPQKPPYGLVQQPESP